MNDLEQHRELIAKAEAELATAPLRYKIRLALLALLGFAYILLMMLGVAGAAVLAVMAASKNAPMLNIVLVPLGVGWLVLCALWFRTPPPQGRRVVQSEVPALFAEIEQVRLSLNAKPIHEVLLTTDFNAGVVQVSRLGLLGWPKRYLVIGMPLLASLPPYQFRAVLAHELGHLARNHFRFMSWIYLMRQTWCRILEVQKDLRSPIHGACKRFFAWYAPYFNAYSFVLARKHEYQADLESARVTSRDDTADALAAVCTRTEYIESHFWSEFYTRAQTQPEPSLHPFSDYVTALRNLPIEQARASLAAVLGRNTGLSDTHPSLKDRLRALRAKANLPLRFQLSAAHTLLRDQRLTLMHEFNAIWRGLVQQPWKLIWITHAKLDRYQATQRAGTLTVEDQWDFARTAESARGGAAALPILDDLLARVPDHAPAYYMRGRILLSMREERGIADVETAMRLDAGARWQGAQVLFEYFNAKADLARCEPYRAILLQLSLEARLAGAERAKFTRKDTFEAHGLSPAQLPAWAAAVATHKVKRAWLVRKNVTFLQHKPAYVLMLEFGFFQWVSETTLQAVTRSLPQGEGCLVVNRSGLGHMRRKIERAAGGCLWTAAPRRSRAPFAIQTTRRATTS